MNNVKFTWGGRDSFTRNTYKGGAARWRNCGCTSYQTSTRGSEAV